MVDLGEVGRSRRGAPDADLIEIDGRKAAVVVADDQALVRVVDGQRARARRRQGRDQLSGPEVVGPDLAARGDVEPLAGTRVRQRAGRRACRRLVDTARLDGGGDDRHAEVARGVHVVAAPQHDPGSHQVLGQVRVRPLVDVVRQAVAPVLQELRGRPGVVDLVEVHLLRLVEPEGAKHHRADDQDDDDPQVELVEPSAALVAERRRPIRPHGRIAVSRLQPADHAELVERRPGGPARHRGDRSRGGGRGATTLPEAQPPPLRARP